MNYRVLRTVLDSSSFGLAQAGDLVELDDSIRAEKMVNDGILEKVDMNKAQYFTKVEQVAEKAVEVPVTPETVEEKEEEVTEDRKPGRPKKAE